MKLSLALNRKGFSLVELLIVMAMFIIVIIIASDAFNRIITNSRKLAQSEESNIEGVIGLEMMRHDIEQAGYGLPWVPMSFTNDMVYFQDSPTPQVFPTYKECGLSLHRNFNDGAPSPLGYIGAPRPIVTGNNLAAASGTYNILANTDYLAIKAASLGRSNASKRNTYIGYSSVNGVPIAKEPKRWPAASDNIPNGNSVIIINREADANTPSTLVAKLKYSTATPIPANYHYQAFPSPGNAFPLVVSPDKPQDLHIVYGIDDGSAWMPFNRVNYFVARPSNVAKIPQGCPTSIGNLYKASVDHADGGLTYMPVLDCVADMQIVLGWNFGAEKPENTSVVDTYSNADGSIVSSSVGVLASQVQLALANATTLRRSLKLVKVYVLAMEGKKSADYTSPSPIVVGGDGEAILTKSFDIAAAGLSNYRWKVYRIISRPKNIL